MRFHATAMGAILATAGLVTALEHHHHLSVTGHEHGHDHAAHHHHHAHEDDPEAHEATVHIIARDATKAKYMGNDHLVAALHDDDYLHSPHHVTSDHPAFEHGHSHLFPRDVENHESDAWAREQGYDPLPHHHSKVQDSHVHHHESHIAAATHHSASQHSAVHHPASLEQRNVDVETDDVEDEVEEEVQGAEEEEPNTNILKRSLRNLHDKVMFRHGGLGKAGLGKRHSDLEPLEVVDASSPATPVPSETPTPTLPHHGSAHHSSDGGRGSHGRKGRSGWW